MFTRKAAACLTGLMMLALALPVLASAKAPESAADGATGAAQEAAVETDQPGRPDQTGQPDETDPPSGAEGEAPASLPDGEQIDETQKPGAMALFLNGKDVTGGAVNLSWDASQPAPTALIRATSADGRTLSPAFASSNASVLTVDASGVVTAAGRGVATVTATLDGKTASLQITVGGKVERVVIICEDTLAPGHSMKLRAFDQNGDRISVLWRSSSDALARVTPDGVMTAGRGAQGQSVDITALAGEGSSVYAVKTVEIG